MTTTPASAPRPNLRALSDAELQALIIQTIADAYAPEDCESCEINEGTCTECAGDALADIGINTTWTA